jgi:hypothetical protein
VRLLLSLLLLTFSALGQQLSHDDAVRLGEFYRLSAQIQNQIWPGWSKVPSPLLLVTADREFLIHHPAPPKEFIKVSDDISARPRQFSRHLLATFPAFDATPVIVIGEPQDTEAKTSTPWLITLIHEHFHQLQYEQPGYYDGIKKLGLSGGDQSGMWMLNYPFPYENPRVTQTFAHLRDMLLAALQASNEKEFRPRAEAYIHARQQALAELAPDDHKYLSFQLWQEGVARYTQIKAAEAAAGYQPSADYKELPDYEPFSSYAGHARSDTLSELKKADLAQWKRTFFYSFGGSEGLFLDRWDPQWKDDYFTNPFSTDPYFVLRH